MIGISITYYLLPTTAVPAGRLQVVQRVFYKDLHPLLPMAMVKYGQANCLWDFGKNPLSAY